MTVLFSLHGVSFGVSNVKLSPVRLWSICIMKGGTQGFPRHEVSDKQEVLFEDVSPSTAFSIRQHHFHLYVCFIGRNSIMQPQLEVSV